jgi:DNA polymerase I
VSAVYGLARVLSELIDTYDPAGMVVCFDTSRQSFRSELLPTYKAHRPSMPDDLRSQQGMTRELLSAWSIPTWAVPGYEADDLIGSLSAHWQSEGRQVIIVSSDKDMLQLVNSQVGIWHAFERRGTELSEVYAKYGIYPTSIPDYLGLCGDSADNIP